MSDNNKKGIFYGIIGVATLIIAIIGATFAYFTATQTAGQNNITGNAATISFGLTVRKVTTVDDEKGGIIPMTDAMADAAVNGKTIGGTNDVCVDDNGNAVCQIYEITITNTGTASMFLDGFIDLKGGLDGKNSKLATGTNMRWIQVFATNGTVTGTNSTTFTSPTQFSVSTTGTNIAPGVDTAAVSYGTSAHNQSGVTSLNTLKSTGSYTFNGNSYEYISNNYMRTSGHDLVGGYTRTGSVDSTLVINQYITPMGQPGSVVKLYFMVWLTETGSDQTPDAAEQDGDIGYHFFSGLVEFNSASGGEVSATFGGFTRA